MPSGEKFCRKPPIQSSELSPPSTDSSLFSPELPPVETAVMRALVGSDGSTGSVPGTRYAMLAKLRSANGKVARSRAVTTPPFTALMVSMGCEVMEEGVADTFTCCWDDAGFRTTKIYRTVLTLTITVELASAKPGAWTVTR